MSYPNVKRTAAGDIAKYAPVKLDNNGDVVETAGAGDQVFGIAQESVKSGEEVAIDTEGDGAQALIDGSGTNLSVGDELQPDAGTFVIHDGNAGSAYAGQLTEVDDGTQAGEIARVRLYDRRSTEAS